ncbi:MAG: hypothetical protein EOO73_36090 [Myxococcales bacterium]|nr:MAG: hypothetical protein EOO73_36090 [Myxococcales bacterium]
MRAQGSVMRFVGCGLFVLLVGCEEEKPIAKPTVASAAPAVPVPAPPTSATTAPTPARKDGERPAKIETELTPARRAAIETKYPAAKGFVDAADLQGKLKANKALKDKKAAVAAFDRLARGKWVLFTGPLVNLKDDSFDIGFEYTPQLPNDPMGMSRQFFEVSMSKVEGYEKDLFKGGNLGVVLVKYNGATQAGPGYELVAAGAWP